MLKTLHPYLPISCICSYRLQMNKAGLVFDGFSEDYKAISDTLGKKSLRMDFLKDILKTCATVDEVKKYFNQYNLSGLETSMFLFIDKTGKYLVVEGDSLIIGNKPCYVLSNFYPSQVKDENEIDIPLYQKGRRLNELPRRKQRGILEQL